MVLFKKDKSVEIIQKSWIKTSKTLKTFWPTAYNGKDINTIVKDSESITDPSYGWKPFGIEILYACSKLFFYFQLQIFQKCIHSSNIGFPKNQYTSNFRS